jgi:hypothetical protein
MWSHFGLRAAWDENRHQRAWPMHLAPEVAQASQPFVAKSVSNSNCNYYSFGINEIDINSDEFELHHRPWSE